MKKLVNIFVLLVYSATTLGATVHLHYCMDKYVGWTLWQNEKDNKCGKCGMTEKKGGCCKDEQKQIKLDADQQKSNPEQYIQLIATPALITSFATHFFRASRLPHFTPLSNAPPLIPKRLHLLNCVFLI